MLLVHEVLAKEHGSKPNPDGADNLEVASLPAFAEHPVAVRAKASGLHWSKTLPISLYWDGVRYTTRENFEGFFIYDHRADRRHLCWLYRAPGRNSYFVMHAHTWSSLFVFWGGAHLRNCRLRSVANLIVSMCVKTLAAPYASFRVAWQRQ